MITKVHVSKREGLVSSGKAELAYECAVPEKENRGPHVGFANSRDAAVRMPSRLIDPAPSRVVPSQT
jgi:hypothetical protein